jgi:hypothetical protein
MISLIASNSWAQDVIYLEKNKPAPYSGVLFPESKAEDLRRQVIDSQIIAVQKEGLAKELDIQQRIVRLKDEEIELYRTQNNTLVKANSSSETLKWVYFGLGIVVTGAAVYGARSLSK